jgi:hypothetical protein
MKSKPQSSEYKAFEDLLGQVLSVSKTELNRRIAEEKSEKRTPSLIRHPVKNSPI